MFDMVDHYFENFVFLRREFRRDARQKPEGILESLVRKLRLLYEVRLLYSVHRARHYLSVFVERRSRQSVRSHQ